MKRTSTYAVITETNALTTATEPEISRLFFSPPARSEFSEASRM
ncbi:hypothetical protein OG943_16525 [Amycolatopsis sp. NBC_00345]